MIEIIPPPPVPGESVQTLYTESRPAIEPVSIFDAPEEKNLGVDVRLWHSDLAGQIDSRGMNLGLSADTSISAQSSGNLSGSWQFADNTQLQLDYFKFDHSGHTNRNVTFDNRNYAAGSTIRLRNNIFGLGLSHILSENDEGSFKLLYGFRFSQLNTKIEQSFAAGIRAGELDQNIGMPYLGVEGTARLSDNAGLTGSARFFDFDKNGEANRLSDFDLAFEFGRDYQNMPASQEWYGVLGYRYFMLHDESDGNSSRVVYSGPVLGLRGKF
ncbi:MAG: hypothetical protein CVV42_17380 [Candidatus Riflebacteria bacterium HGW-Riflebacteria-2]|nr:MAG: hypothetical protein CVV42_17380 [Candidatus Riflebacteria bacterium HGW-Riflebacteria-2]